MTLISSHTLTKWLPNSSSRTYVKFLTRITLLLLRWKICYCLVNFVVELTNDLPLKEHPRKNAEDYGNLLLSHLFVIIGAWMSNNQKVHNKMRDFFSSPRMLRGEMKTKCLPNCWAIFWRKKFAARFNFLRQIPQRECIQLSLAYLNYLMANWTTQKIIYLDFAMLMIGRECEVGSLILEHFRIFSNIFVLPDKGYSPHFNIATTYNTKWKYSTLIMIIFNVHPIISQDCFLNILIRNIFCSSSES